MKKALKFLLVVFVYSALFTITNMVLPFSQAFRDMNASANPLSAVYLFISSVFICFTICFIARKASWRGTKRILGIIAVVFLVVSFMTQIETLFFGSSFEVLTKPDILLIMLAMLPSIICAALLGVKFFGRKEDGGSEQIPEG